MEPRTSPSDLTGRSVVITGAARGLGASIAEACVARGASVLLGDVLVDELAATAERLGERAEWVRLDVTSADDWNALADRARSSGGRPDVLVNNAGIVRPATIDATSLDDFELALSVNVVGTFLGIKTYVALHDEFEGPTSRRPGSIVNIASVRGLIGANRAVGYCASKFAVRGITKATAVELGGRGIRVNTVCPGPIETEMSRGNPAFAHVDWDGYVGRLPLGHMGAPIDIGEAVAWLASDASAFVTGIDLPVDGGLTATSYSPEPRRSADPATR